MRRRFTLVEVAIATLVFAIALSSILTMLGTARSRLVRAQRRWARGHLLAQAVELHLLTGDRGVAPPEFLPQGFRTSCAVLEVRALPDGVEPSMNGWRLAVYEILLDDPAGVRIGERQLVKIVPEAL